MAKKIDAYVKLQIPAGKAIHLHPSSSIGSTWCEHYGFLCKEFNAATQKMEVGQINSSCDYCIF